MSDEALRTRIINRIQTLSHEELLRVATLLGEIAKNQSGDVRRTPNQNQSGDVRRTPNILPAKDWPHAPLHRIGEHGTYMVTCGTLYKQHFFRGPDRLHLLESKLLELAKKYQWQLEAWAIFSNHYLVIAHSPPGADALNVFLRDLHADTATRLNRMDGTAGRQVWYNYWDTKLTFQRSYLARLNYVHQNAVKHGLVPVANQYRWCSAAWFEATATLAQVKTVYSFKIDKLRVFDDFEVV